MNAMSEATEISKNVFLGPPPEYLMTQNPDLTSLPYDLYIECTDSGTFPALSLLDGMLGELSDPIRRLLLMMEIPGSGALAMQELSQQEIKGLLRVCRFIWQIAHGSEHEGVRDWEAVHSRQDADTRPIEEGHRHRKPQRVLIMCADGYTENSLLGLAYLMFIDCIPAHEAWIRLHKAKGRDFFAYPADVHLLRFLQSTILEESPNFSKGSIASPEPSWFGRMDGSLPNRILPYMYLGNLRHANNPDLLLEMGITQIISVGEEVTWSENRRRQWSKDRILRLRNVQDNGLDSLTDEFDRCLEFLSKWTYRYSGIEFLHLRF